jgi:Secretion system C-terminal sorting domain
MNRIQIRSVLFLFLVLSSVSSLSAQTTTTEVEEYGNKRIIKRYSGSYFDNIAKKDYKPQTIVLKVVRAVGELKFEIFPNPTDDIAKFTLEGQGNFDLQIIDLLGNTVLNKSYASGGENELDVSMLAGGTYFAVVVLPDGTKYRSKFVKK